jgi:hypothetical protein
MQLAIGTGGILDYNEDDYRATLVLLDGLRARAELNSRTEDSPSSDICATV